MNFDVWKGLLIPFLGTTLGAGVSSSCAAAFAGRCSARSRGLPPV